MKSRILYTLFLLICCFPAFSEIYNFEVKEIEFSKNDNKIITGNGKAYSKDGSLEIEADQFIYSNDTKILNASGNGFFSLKKKNIYVKFVKAIFDKINNTIELNNKIEIIYFDKKIFIESDKIIYNQIDNKLTSSTKTQIIDDLKNVYLVDNFLFEISEGLIKAENIEIKDKDNNYIKTEIGFLNLESNNFFGKDININLKTNSLSQNAQPRLKGNSLASNKLSNIITKGSFTSCKKREGCPPWQLNAKKITHDKKKQIINYDHAYLKLYDVPVFYFPKFFHPDPTVKKKSGFLIPSFKNSNKYGQYLNLPYYLLIAENRDLTFSPRIYGEEFLLQTEYRHLTKNSNHLLDFGLLTENNKKTKNHVFYSLNRNVGLNKFNDGTLKLKVQKTNNDNYLEINKINSEIDFDENILENSLELNLFSNDVSLNINANIYENLDKSDHDRYEYILPEINLSKNLNSKNDYNGNFSFTSLISAKHFNTNIFENRNINDLNYSSYPKISSNGFYNNFDIMFRNSNQNNKNSVYKNKESYFFSGMVQFNSTLPLIKESESFQKILSPKVSVRFAPPHTKDERNTEKKIDVSNIYSLDRTVDNDTVEGGISLTYSSEYSIQNKQNSNEIFNFKFANNLRLNENDDLSNHNQIGEKTSNFFSEIIYSPNEYFSMKYNTSIKNNLEDKTYENLLNDFKINNFTTTIDYTNENNTIAQNSYLKSSLSYLINENNNISFSTRENKTQNLTEYYNLIYEYINDCLTASIEYSKNFYNDRELKPNTNLFFKLSIIPFGQSSSPNLYK